MPRKGFPAAGRGRGRAVRRDVRVATSEGRGAPALAGRREAPEFAAGDPGEFGTMLDRAGEAALDALLAELVAPPAPGPPRGPAAPMLARAIERVALVVQAGVAPSVTVRLGRSLEVRVAHGDAGVEVALQAAEGLSPAAEAELPVLVAALRARGVRVARAGVVRRRGSGRASLTARRGSATNAPDDGTVAKW